MSETVSVQSAALESLRRQLGSKIRSGSDLLREREGKEIGPATGFVGLDEALGGGLPRGQLAEIVARRVSCGAGLAMAALLARAREEGRYAMLLDIGSGFSVESFPERDLESLLWVGCDSAKQAVEALDVATRDENFHLFLVDGRDCEPSDWRAVRAQQWYRILHQLRRHEALAVILSRSEVTAVAKHRLEVFSRLDLECLHRERCEILNGVAVRPVRHSGDARGGELRAG